MELLVETTNAPTKLARTEEHATDPATASALLPTLELTAANLLAPLDSARTTEHVLPATFATAPIMLGPEMIAPNLLAARTIAGTEEFATDQATAAALPHSLA